MRTLAFILFLVAMVLMFFQTLVLAFGAPVPLPQGPLGVTLLIFMFIAFLASLIYVQVLSRGN